MESIRLKARAKINLGLDVLRKEKTVIMMCVWLCRPLAYMTD